MSESGTEIVLTINKIHVHAKETLPLCLFIFGGKGGGGVTWRMKVALSCHKSMSPCLFTTLKKENTIIIIQKAFYILYIIFYILYYYTLSSILSHFVFERLLSKVTW